MVETYHAALPESEPAQPILASHLLASEEKQRRRFASRGESIKTGCGEIDDYVLGGGFERGIVVGISAEGGEGRLISLHLLASILLSHLTASPNSSPANFATPTKTRATIIDSTGSFPLSELSKVIATRIRLSRPDAARQAVSTGNYGLIQEKQENLEGVDEQLQKCLEMVAISRVFDFEGLWEVFGEVGRNYPPREHVVGGTGEDFVPGNRDEQPEGMEEIGESQAEDILLESGQNEEEDHEDGTELIIVDSMTHIINELFTRKEKNEAHTLLTSLSHAIHTLTRTSNVLTILHNSTTPKKPPHPTSTHHPPPLSIFPSNPVKPALGHIFASFPDLHLLLSLLPKTIQDAEVLYGRDVADLVHENARVTYCVVVEVLKDETPALGARNGVAFAAREQRWGAVEVRGDNGEGMNFVGAFAGKRGA